MSAFTEDFRLPPTIATALALLSAIGFADDRASTSGGLPAVKRLLVQVEAAFALTYDRSVLASIGSVTAVTSIVNVVNFMDGINGMTAITALVWGANAALSADRETRWFGSAVAGAALGFLPWNAPVASLFLGDVGSYLFGGLIASAIIHTQVVAGSTLPVAVLFAPLIPYFADATQAIAKHVLSNAPIAEAHRDHIYQSVVDHHQLGHLQMAVTHGVFAACSAAAWRLLPPRGAAAASVAIGSLYIALPHLLGLRTSPRVRHLPFRTRTLRPDRARAA